jgi:hypothetical protein
MRDSMGNDIKESLKKFKKMLEDYPDESGSTYNFSNFLKLFLRSRAISTTLPTVEVMTIIKHEKPTIYYNLRQQGNFDSTMEFLTSVSIDYDKANENINKILSD